jgi:hypothetical protein
VTCFTQPERIITVDWLLGQMGKRSFGLVLLFLAV